MSTTIDQRVVEMRFDNQNFEKNVHTTMSTLEKLKQKLNLTGASKGLEEVNAAARKVNMSGLGRNIETITSKFSTLDIVGTTALVNITNQAVNAGKRIVSALTVAPIGDGFKEYEMTLNAVQTTMAATGKTAEDVESQLKKLDEYADKTVYGTADMLSNLPKFTNAGVDLEKATTAMIGIANATALAGGDASKASIAFYNLGQAIGTGYLTRMDYNSINNAGIATIKWKEAMVDAAIAQGTLVRVGEDAYQAGNKTLTLQQLFIDGLQEQWATTDVMMKVFGDYGDATTQIGKEAYAAAQDIKTYTMMMESLKATAGTGWKDTWQILFGGLTDAKQFWTGLNNVIGDVITNLAEFRNSMLKSALGSKWDKLASKIEKAGFTTEQFTDKVGEVLEESGVSVSELIEKYGSLGAAISAGAVPVKKLTTALKRLLGMEGSAKETTERITMSVEELEAVAKRVLGGEFGSGEERIRRLTEAGYDYATVQNKVNELLGSSVRHVSNLTEEQLANADSLAKMTDEQLKAKGYTEEQIEVLRELEKAADGAGSSITDLLNDLERPSGRTLLLDSFANIWKQIKEITSLIGEAWVNIFGKKDAEYYAEGLYGVIEMFHDMTESMEISEDSANNFRTVMEGLFSLFQLTGSVASKSIVGSLKILNAVLGYFGSDILELASFVAEKITQFNKWVQEETIFGWGSMQTKMGTILGAIIKGIVNCINAFKNLEKVQAIVQRVKDAITSFFDAVEGPVDFFSPEGIQKAIEDFFLKLENWIKGIDFCENFGLYLAEGIRTAINSALDGLIAWVDSLTIFDKLGMNIIKGIPKGMLEAAKGIFNTVIDIAISIYETFCEIFQVNSPSRLMMTLGGFLISGLILGIVQGFGDVSGVLQDLITKCTDGVDWSKFSAIFWNISAMIPSAPILNTIAALANTFSVFGDESANDIISGLVQGLAGGAQKVVTAIVQIASDLIESFKNKIDSHSPSKVFIAIGGFIIAGLLLGLKEGVNDLPKTLQDIVDGCTEVLKNIPWKGLFIAGFSVASLVVIKKFADAVENFSKPFGKMGSLLSALTETVRSFGDVTKALALNIKTKALKQLAIALAILVGSVVAITLLVDDPVMLWNAVGVIGALVIVLGVLALAMNQLGEASIKFEKGKGFTFNGLRQSLLSIGLAILMVGSIVAIMGRMKKEELTQGFDALLKAMVSMLAFVAALHLIGKMKGADNIDAIGSMAVKLSIAMLLMIGVMKLAGKLKPSELTKGIIFMAAFGLFIKALSAAVDTGSNAWSIGKGGISKSSTGKLGSTLIGVTVAMGLMVGICKLAAKLDASELGKGAIFAAAFVIFVRQLVKAATVGSVAYFGNGSSVAAGGNLGKIGGMLLGATVAMTLMVGICKLAAQLDAKEMGKGAIFAIAFLGFVKGLVWAATIAPDTQIAKITGTLLGLSIAVGALAGLCLVLKYVTLPELAKGIAAVGLLSLFMMGMIWAARGVQDIKGTMIALVVGIGLMAGIVAALMLVKDPKKLIAPVTALGTLLVAFGFAIRSLAAINPQKGLLKSLATMLVITTILGGIVWALSHFVKNPDAALYAAVGLSALMLAFAGALTILSKSEQKTTAAYKQIWKMLAVSAVLGAVLTAMSRWSNPDALIESAVSLGILLNTFASSIWILSKSATKTTKAYGVILDMTGVAIAAAVLLTFMSRFAKADSLIESAVSLGILLNTFASSIWILSKSATKTTKAYGVIFDMTGVAIAAAVLLTFMSRFAKADSLIDSAVSLGILLNAFASSILILSIIKAPVTVSQKTLWSMVGVTAVFALVVAGLSQIHNIEAARANAITLSGFMLAMTGLMAIVSIIGKFLGTGTVKGIAGLAAMVIPLKLFAWALKDVPDLSGSKESILTLTQVMTGMTVLLAAVSAIGMFLAAGVVPGIIALCGFMAVMGVFVVIVGQLMERFPQIQTWVDKGIPILVQLAGGIGEMIGAFIEILGAAVGRTLVQFGEDIASFMDALSRAADNASGIESGSFDGVYDLVKVLGDIAIVAAGTQLADWFVLGGTSMDKFKTDALAFFAAMKEIAPKMADCKMPENFSADGVISLLDALKKIGGYGVSSQISEWFYFGGDKTTLDKFKSDAINFFDVMKELPEHMTGFNFPENFNIEGLTTLLTVLKKVAWSMAGVSFADLFAQFAGDEGAIEKFKTDAINFFRAIKAIVPEMVGFSFPKDFDVDGLTKLLDSLKAVAWAMTGVSIGDMFAQVVGDEGTIEKFESDGKDFFSAIKAISDEMIGFAFPENFSAEGLSRLLDVFKMVAKSIRGTSWAEVFTVGSNDSMEQFETRGVDFFKAIKAISNEATGITTESFDSSMHVIDKLKQVFESLKGIDYSGVEMFTGIGTGGFGADGPMHDIGVAIRDFATQILGVDVEALNTAITAAGKLRTFINNLVGLDVSGIETYKSAIDSLGRISLNKFVETFNAELPDISKLGGNIVTTLTNGIRAKAPSVSDAGRYVISTLANGVNAGRSAITAYINAILTNMVDRIKSRASAFGIAGTTLMTQFVNSISKASPQVSAGINSVLENARNNIRAYHSPFYNAGSYLVSGFVSGINDNMYKASAKAAAMAKAALEAAQKTLGINSPSKEFYKIGGYTGQGFINALRDYGSKVYDAGSEMADSAKNGLSDAIGKVMDVVNGNVELQPTIRPVVDLSDVQAGAGAINGLLGFGTSVGVAANLGAISATMNTNQNGGNGDIVSAIEKLRKDMSNLRGDTYQINGVDYSGDADIEAAFETIARAALVGRRV